MKSFVGAASLESFFGTRVIDAALANSDRSFTQPTRSGVGVMQFVKQDASVTRRPTFESPFNYTVLKDAHHSAASKRTRERDRRLIFHALFVKWCHAISSTLLLLLLSYFLLSRVNWPLINSLTHDSRILPMNDWLLLNTARQVVGFFFRIFPRVYLVFKKKCFFNVYFDVLNLTDALYTRWVDD